jgi:hypothetical protein
MGDELSTTVKVDLRGKCIAIGSPAYGDSFCSEYVRSALETQVSLIKHGVDLAFITARDALVTRARNALISVFMDIPEATHLWFMDADMGWRPDAPLRMIASGHDVCGVAGKRKVEKPSYCVNVEAPYAKRDALGFITVNDIGTGCMLVSKKALLAVMEAFPEKYYDAVLGREIPNVFETCVDDNGFFWSEDYTFCRKWRAIGGEIWCDPTQSLVHIGQKAWSGAFQDYLDGKEAA